MPSVYRVTALWNNFPGAPGYSRFSFSDLTDATSRNAAGAKVQALFEAVKAYIPATATIAVQPAIDEFDLGTGALLGTATMTTTPTPTTSTATNAGFSGASGACWTWSTNMILNRRRVRGRTFLVPMAGAALDTNGSLSAGALTAMQNAAATFVAATAPRPNVWSRQWSTAHPPVQIGGAIASIESYSVRDQVAVLRSRRV